MSVLEAGDEQSPAGKQSPPRRLRSTAHATHRVLDIEITPGQPPAGETAPEGPGMHLQEEFQGADLKQNHTQS